MAELPDPPSSRSLLPPRTDWAGLQATFDKLESLVTRTDWARQQSSIEKIQEQLTGIRVEQHQISRQVHVNIPQAHHIIADEMDVFKTQWDNKLNKLIDNVQQLQAKLVAQDQLIAEARRQLAEQKSSTIEGARKSIVKSRSVALRRSPRIRPEDVEKILDDAAGKGPKTKNRTIAPKS